MFCRKSGVFFSALYVHDWFKGTYSDHSNTLWAGNWTTLTPGSVATDLRHFAIQAADKFQPPSAYHKYLGEIWTDDSQLPAIPIIGDSRKWVICLFHYMDWKHFGHQFIARDTWISTSSDVSLSRKMQDEWSLKLILSVDEDFLIMGCIHLSLPAWISFWV